LNINELITIKNVTAINGSFLVAEQLGKDQTTISKWCTNSSQPDLASLMMTAKVLNVELTDLVRFEEFKNEK
jgi:transcriptional regulator with XRE-family HTH domain